MLWYDMIRYGMHMYMYIYIYHNYALSTKLYAYGSSASNVSLLADLPEGSSQRPFGLLDLGHCTPLPTPSWRY